MEADCSGGQSSPRAVAPRGRKEGFINVNLILEGQKNRESFKPGLSTRRTYIERLIFSSFRQSVPWESILVIVSCLKHTFFVVLAHSK
jgi:hypothetical protein